ncbi:MAG: hypothetical protein KTV68_19375 [Acidimicrobiia bacterium]|nr:hypothetical protein [Acidimicrobiia bacterium]
MGEDKGSSSDPERLVAHEVSPAEQPYGGTEEVEITATLSQAPLPHPEIYGEFERQVPGTAEWLRETAGKAIEGERENRHQLQMEDLRLEHKGQRLTTTVNAVVSALVHMFMFSAYVAIGYFGTAWFGLFLGVLHLLLSNGVDVVKRLAKRVPDDPS